MSDEDFEWHALAVLPIRGTACSQPRRSGGISPKSSIHLPFGAENALVEPLQNVLPPGATRQMVMHRLYAII